MRRFLPPPAAGRRGGPRPLARARGGRRGRQHLQFAPLRHRPAAVGRVHQGDRHQGQRRRRHARAADPADAERGRQQPGRRVHHRRRRPARPGERPRPAAADQVAGARRAASRPICATRMGYGMAWPCARACWSTPRTASTRRSSAPTRRWPSPAFKGKVLVRSSTNVYNLSLVGSILAADGPEATETWCKGLVANMARPPEGGDTDQLKAVAAGVGDVAISNTYYLARLKASTKPEDQAIGEQLAVFFPNQGDRGTHVNVSGAGVLKTRAQPGQRGQADRVSDRARGTALLRRRQPRVPGQSRGAARTRCWPHGASSSRTRSTRRSTPRTAPRRR